MAEPALIVACLGSSGTARKSQAFNWIGELQKRLNWRCALHTSVWVAISPITLCSADPRCWQSGLINS